VQQAPGIPCALRFSGVEIFFQASGAVRRENAKLYPPVIAGLELNLFHRRKTGYACAAH
jgi:hypothetical protein